VRIEFLANDLSPGNWLEAAVDIFQVAPVTVGVQADLDASVSITVSPNPSASEFAINYAWEQAENNPVLEVYNLVGQLVYTEKLSSKTGYVLCGNAWKSGVYFAKLKSDGRVSAAVKLVRQ